MKYSKILVYVLVFLLMIPYSVQASGGMHNKKACWISYEDIYNNLCDKTEAEFRLSLNLMYDNIIENNMNTVIMHVRTMGDAMYPSAYFPWSVYINSDRNGLDYDPLEIMVQMAHDKELKIEAWINPYRISLGDSGSLGFKETKFYNEYSSFIMEYENSNGEICMVFDPAKQESRDLISNGVREIVTNYDVDGIHFDDYFYVDGMAEDLSEEEKRNNVNMLIKQVYSTIKEVKVDCEFGISPAGNISNARAQGADVDSWMSEDGYIDYIMPQIYWSDSFVTDDGITAMFSERCNQWMELNELDIPIYVGLALYRVGEESSYDLGWSQSDENLYRQYKKAYSIGYDGYALFRYGWLDKDISKDELDNLNRFIHCMEGKGILEHSKVSYTTYIREMGWQLTKTDGIVSGDTSGDNSLEGVSIRLGDKVDNGGISYRTYVRDTGWTKWTYDGQVCGGLLQGQPVMSLQIKLTDEAAEGYNVYYRVYVTNEGWLNWVKNGEAAGNVAYEEEIQAIQIIVAGKS